MTNVKQRGILLPIPEPGMEASGKRTSSLSIKEAPFYLRLYHYSKNLSITFAAESNCNPHRYMLRVGTAR
jgi:hypothetical protein